MNLQELLAHFNNLDAAADGDLPLDMDVMGPDELKAALSDKVEALDAVLSRLRSEGSRLYAVADRLRKAAARVEKNADRLEEWISYSMSSQGFEKIPGEVHNIVLLKSYSVKPTQEPNAEIALKYPDYVVRKVAWQWDKVKIKERLQAGVEFEYGQLVESRVPKFRLRKDDL